MPRSTTIRKHRHPWVLIFDKAIRTARDEWPALLWSWKRAKDTGIYTLVGSARPFAPGLPRYKVIVRYAFPASWSTRTQWSAVGWPQAPNHRHDQGTTLRAALRGHRYSLVALYEDATETPA